MSAAPIPKPAFTAGPWKSLVMPPSNLDKSGTTMVSTTYFAGMAIDCMDSASTFDECAANARLIAAAPDLYEALEDLFNRCIVELADAEDLEEIGRARAALAKARA